MTIENAIRTDALGPYLEKDPRARIPVSVDWSEWLAQESTTIASSAWTLEAGPVLDGQTNTPTIATAFVSGGTVGSRYVLRNTITTANGLIDSRSLRVVIRDR